MISRSQDHVQLRPRKLALNTLTDCPLEVIHLHNRQRDTVLDDSEKLSVVHQLPAIPAQPGQRVLWRIDLFYPLLFLGNSQIDQLGGLRRLAHQFGRLDDLAVLPLGHDTTPFSEECLRFAVRTLSPHRSSASESIVPDSSGGPSCGPFLPDSGIGVSPILSIPWS